MRAIRNPTGDADAVVGRDVVVAYGRTVVIAASDVTIPRARLTSVIGPNGAGKSTLLHAIAGLVELRSGSLAVLGARPEAARARVAYVFQTARVNDNLPVTVSEVVGMGRYASLGPFGRFRTADRAAVDRAMESMGILDLRRHHLRELSGGQRQRVFVAQGLAQDADVLLLDEPLTGLDIPSHERIDTVLEAEVARGVTVVVTTHDLDEARRADHVVVLAGRVVASGTPEVALDDAVLAEAYGGHLLHFDEGPGVVLDDAAHGRGTPHDAH